MKISSRTRLARTNNCTTTSKSNTNRPQSLQTSSTEPGTTTIEAMKPVENGEDIWYFAYGSNMNSKTLTGQRKVDPAESVAAVLPNYKLTFQMPGIPYREPCFASVSPSSSSPKPTSKNGNTFEFEVHGVAHKLTYAQWQTVLATEGGAHTESDTGYAAIDVDAHLYDGRIVPVKTLIAKPKTSKLFRGRTVLPSQRYLKLLQEGAADHGLSTEYIKYLHSLEPYNPRGFRRTLGGFLFGLIVFGLIVPVFLPVRLWREVILKAEKAAHPVGTVNNKFMSYWFQLVFAICWGIHEVLRPVLTDGASNVTGHMR